MQAVAARVDAGVDRHRFAAEADLHLFFETELRFGDGFELRVGRGRDQHRRVGPEGADELGTGGAAAAASGRFGGFEYHPLGGELTSTASLAVRPKVGFAADHQGVVGVQGAVDLVAADEGDHAAVLAGFRPGDFRAVPAALDRFGALFVRAFDRRCVAVGDRVQGLELGEVDVVEEARRLEGGDDRGLRFPRVADRADPEGPFISPSDSSMLAVAVTMVVGSQVLCPVVAGISSIA